METQPSAPVPLSELAIVFGVGFLLAFGTAKIPALNDRKMLTRAGLYTLGYYLATKRPPAGYALARKA
jgi:hypothetical protein